MNDTARVGERERGPHRASNGAPESALVAAGRRDERERPDLGRDTLDAGGDDLARTSDRKDVGRRLVSFGDVLDGIADGRDIDRTWKRRSPSVFVVRSP